MKKNIIKPLLAIVCLLSSITLYAHDFEVDGICYNITSETGQTVEVTFRGDNYQSYNNKYTGTVVIPESVTYNGINYSVTEIGDYAFLSSYCLTEVTIPNSVTLIGERAFDGCAGLTSITIPNSVTKIGEYAFRYCDGLIGIVVEEGNTVYDSRENCNAIIETASNSLIAGCKNTIIPNSVTSIGMFAFYECTGLTDITIPNSVTEIGDYAFNSSGLTEITIPNSVTSIGVSAFRGCENLTKVIIPNSVTMIGKYAFAECLKLTEIPIPNSVTSIDNGTFYNCAGLLQITIPNSVTMIGEYAFNDCENLTIVTIPNSVLSIGNYAFAGCEKLAVMKVKAKNPPAIKEHTFKGVDKSMHLYVPAGRIGKYQSMSYWSDFINILEEEPMDVQLTLQNSIYNNVVFYLPYGTMQKLEIKTLDDSYVLNSVVFNGKDVTDEIINDVYVTPELTDDAVLNISYDTSSVENVFLNNNRIKAYGHNGNIVVTGCEYGESIAIYDVDGILLRSLLANSDMMRISMPSESIYMVKVADSAIKVAL